MKLIVTTSLLFGAFTTFAQANEIPTSGNVGLGTTDPTEKLDVRGGARIDSTLRIGDSLTVQNSARVGQDLTITGNTYMQANAFVQQSLEVSGILNLPYLKDDALTESELLLIDATGAVRRGGQLTEEVYKDHESAPCTDGNSGYTTPANPTWANKPGRLYTTQHCTPDVKVGIGTANPQSKLHILLNDDMPNINTHALIVEKSDGTKILQLTENGLLQAREIKVDVASWPDYVFDSSYVLLPLSEVAEYIEQNGHLPNAKSACELEKEGMSLSETNVLLMEKVEELTLYLLDLQQQIDALKQTVQQQ